MSMGLMTTVERVEEFDGYTVVVVERKEGAMAPESVQKIEARARAIIQAGIIDIVGGRARDVSKAISELDTDEIRRLTHVQREEGRRMWIHVQT